MKKSAVFLILALLFTFASCDTSKTTTIRIATGSSTRAEASDYGVSYVVIAAYQGTIDHANMVGMTTAPAGSVATLVVPADTHLEILVASADADMVMMPYFGIGYYQPDTEEELVTVYMEKRIFEYPSVSISGSPDPVEYIEGAPSYFKVNWTTFRADGFFEDGFDGIDDIYLKTGLFQMLIYRGAGSSDDMQLVGTDFPSEQTYEDHTPFTPNMDYYFSISLSIPTMGLEGPASGPESIFAYEPI